MSQPLRRGARPSPWLVAVVAVLVLAEASWWLLDGWISWQFRNCCTFGSTAQPVSDFHTRLAVAELVWGAAHLPALAVGIALLWLRCPAAARVLLLAVQAIDVGLAVYVGVTTLPYGGWANGLLLWSLALVPAAGLVLVWNLGATARRPAGAVRSRS